MGNSGLVKCFLTVQPTSPLVSLSAKATRRLNREVSINTTEGAAKQRHHSTTTFVVVCSTPDTAWIFEMIVIPNALISGPSTKAMTSCGPVTACESFTPGIPDTCLATSLDRPAAHSRKTNADTATFTLLRIELQVSHPYPYKVVQLHSPTPLQFI